MAINLKDNNNNPTISREARLALPSSFRIVDVPADGNCLFWAAALAYLLSLHNDQFEEGFKRLFGEEYLSDLRTIKTLVKHFTLLDITNLHEHPVLYVLVSQIFRGRVVAYMEAHREAFEPVITMDFDSYLETMADPEVWGGDSEIKAMSGLLNCTIFVIPSWYNGHRLKFGEGKPILYLLHQSNHYYFALNRGHRFFIKEFRIMADQLDFSASETKSKSEEATGFNRDIFHQEFQSIANNFNRLFPKKNKVKSSYSSPIEKKEAKTFSKLSFQLAKKSTLGAFLELGLHIHFSAAAFSYFFFREQVEAPLSLLKYPFVLENLEPNTNWEKEAQKEIDFYLSHTTCGYVGLSGALMGGFYVLSQQYGLSIKKGLKQTTSATLSYFFSKPQNDEERVPTPYLGLHKRVGR
jgi:hypothetical protein